MKILHILNELRPSGAEEMLRIAAPSWLSLGYELHILSISIKLGEYAAQLSTAGWKIHTTSCKGGPLTLWQAIQKTIRDVQPDVLHIHPEAYGLLPVIIGKINGIPTIRTVHSNFHFAGLLRIRKSVERGLARFMGVRFLAISNSVLGNEMAKFHNPCTLCWNWIDSEQFRPPSQQERTNAREQLGLPADRYIIVSVGNAGKVKNYQSIIEAIALLKMPDVLYCQVGNLHPEGTDKAAVHRHGLESQIQFCGPRHDILQWLWAADAFVMPSLYEGFGLAAVEALAAGAPCIFSDVPGLCDFKDLGFTGRWISNTPEALADAISDLKRHPTSPAELLESSDRARVEFGSHEGALRYASQWTVNASN